AVRDSRADRHGKKLQESAGDYPDLYALLLPGGSASSRLSPECHSGLLQRYHLFRSAGWVALFRTVLAAYRQWERCNLLLKPAIGGMENRSAIGERLLATGRSECCR